MARRRWTTPGIVLGLLCTAAAFVIFTVLIREAGTSRATVITYVNPVVAVALGVSLLGERPGAGAVAGLLLILAGSWLSTDGRLPPGLSAWATRRAPGRAAAVVTGPTSSGEGQPAADWAAEAGPGVARTVTCD